MPVAAHLRQLAAARRLSGGRSCRLRSSSCSRGGRSTGPSRAVQVADACTIVVCWVSWLRNGAASPRVHREAAAGAAGSPAAGHLGRVGSAHVNLKQCFPVAAQLHMQRSQDVHGALSDGLVSKGEQNAAARLNHDGGAGWRCALRVQMPQQMALENVQINGAGGNDGDCSRRQGAWEGAPSVEGLALRYMQGSLLDGQYAGRLPEWTSK